MNDTSRAGGDEELPRETTAARDADAHADTRPKADAEAQPDAAPADAGTGTSTGTGTGTDTAPEKEAPEAVRRPSIGSQAEQDAIFAALVAQFDDPVDLNNPQWPEVENLRAQNERKRATAADPGLADFAPEPRPRQGGNPSAAAGAAVPAGPRDYEVAEDPDEGHFVPPEPPPLPQADTTAKFAWLAVLGGPALLLFDALVWREVSGWPAWVGVTAFLGGFATLVARMKNNDEDEGPQDPHDGAVV
ncbi:hypothetical protein ACGFX4_16685 [Kitasatospora sp. NPDC048365]|uniref:hypothetical protein n=1 Tax=Kitasatospora sp. NPDC048365 TaxID=3364050 RepID=UPI003724AF10